MIKHRLCSVILLAGLLAAPLTAPLSAEAENGSEILARAAHTIGGEQPGGVSAFRWHGKISTG